jgi:hypothetical protein
MPKSTESGTQAVENFGKFREHTSMKRSKDNKASAGDTVFLTCVPPGLLGGLPREDKKAISEVVGKPLLLVRYDEDGRAELEFTDSEGVIHFIYVKPDFLRT